MKGDFLTSAFKSLRSRLNASGRHDDDSDDALQDAFYRLWARRNEIHGEREAEGMLAVTVRNIRIDRFRTMAAHPSTGFDGVAEPVQTADDDQTMETYARVNALVNESLSPREREILLRRDRDGWDFDELADSFGLSEANVRMILSRARKKVRDLYRSQNG